MKLIASLFKRFKPRRREESLDFLRGIAVFFMLLAHAIFFFYQGENNILRNAKLIGDTFCFTVFLFVSGTVTYLAYLRQNENASLFHQRLWRRSLIILGSYYIVALVSVVKEFAWPPSISWWQILGEVLIFIKIPGFIEFLIPLILYRLLYFPLKNFYKFVLKDWKRVALASAIIYGLGSILYSLEVSPSLISWKALIVGESNWYTFPLLQYFPIFLIGLYWGKWISATKKSLVEEERAWFVGFYLSLGFALMLISAWAVGIHPGITLNRWPPSPLFLTLGLALVFLLIALDFLLEKLQTRRLWMRLLFFWGKYAFPIFISQALLLQVFKLSGVNKFAHPLAVICGFLFLLIFSSIAAYYKMKMCGPLDRLIEHFKSVPPRRKMKLPIWGKKRQRKIFTKRRLSFIFIILFILLGFVIYNDQLVVKREIQSTPSLTGQVDQTWLLEGDGFTLRDELLRYKVSEIENIELNENTAATYEILGTGKKGKMKQTGEREWETEIEVTELKTGKYRLRAELTSGNKVYPSSISTFFVSYPLYVVWSLDWEGYDVTSAALTAIENIAYEHSLPITHMFNPRIYTGESISPARQEFLTRWIKGRKDNNGDEIGMHLHMFYDFVEEAGVEIRESPKWGDWTDGYDIPLSAYSYDETIKLLTKGLNLFDEHGLGKPISFRSGGWFADSDTLRAIEQSGFQIDSSGREKYNWGKNEITGLWDLAPDALPYQPSYTNQNASGSDSLNIWEIPNNGGSSYNLTSDEMFKNLSKNFPNFEALDNPRVVVYLSHPQWFSLAEQSRVSEIFTRIDNHHYSRDQGPIKYVTLEQIYRLW